MDQKTEARREATKARNKRWREENKDHIRAYQKQWRERNADHVSGYQREYHADYKEREDVQFKTWMRNLHKNYKITPAIFNKMWEDQDGKCAICEQPMQPRGRMKLAATVDHNHETGKVRGLLCRGCNHGIGNLKDDPKVLQSAAEYLMKHGYYSHLKRKSK
jgi:hypothetical protein